MLASKTSGATDMNNTDIRREKQWLMTSPSL
jgi:hypothetical protein